MKKNKRFFKLTSIVLVLAFTLSTIVACKPDDEGALPPAPGSKGGIDLTGFSIIRAYGLDGVVVNQVGTLKDTFYKKLGVSMSSKLDIDTPESDKEILIGQTDREFSTTALAKLKKKTDNDAYIIEITDNKIAIIGTTDKALVRAIKIFTQEYLNMSTDAPLLNVSAGKTYAGLYNSDKIQTLSNGVEIETVTPPTTLFEATGITNQFGFLTDAQSAHYPSITELRYQPNPEDNGKLIAHFCLRGPTLTTNACFMESSDGGKTWNFLSRPEEQVPYNAAAGLKPGQMAHIYELPEAVGKYPAGTLVYASGSINYSIRSEIWIWYSTDCGKTWTQTAKIANGGGASLAVPGWPKQSGVWEPFAWYDNGYLYCFYSDDSDPAHDQKLVYRRSKDGVNWENIVDVCTFDYQAGRPGMFVMTKMGNGEYFMVYEYVNDPTQTDGRTQIYYKTTKDITQWNPKETGTKLETPSSERLNGAPSCIWVPTGGECGTLIVSATATESYLYISFDYGKTWSTFKNPLPYLRAGIKDTYGKPGYSAGFWLGADQRTVYYINTTNIGDTGRCRIQFTSFKIY